MCEINVNADNWLTSKWRSEPSRKSLGTSTATNVKHQKEKKVAHNWLLLNQRRNFTSDLLYGQTNGTDWTGMTLGEMHILASGLCKIQSSRMQETYMLAPVRCKAGWGDPPIQFTFNDVESTNWRRKQTEQRRDGAKQLSIWRAWSWHITNSSTGLCSKRANGELQNATQTSRSIAVWMGSNVHQGETEATAETGS